jgi:hypothetical protein
MNEKIASRWNKWRIVVLITALGIVSLLVFEFVLARGIPAKKNCAGPEIEMFRTQLTLIPSSDISERKSLEEKIVAWETMIAICENATPVTDIPVTTPQFTPITPAPFTTGIFEGQPGAYFHAFEAKIENHWKGVVNGNRVIVFAGAWINDPSQGFIAVETAPGKGKPVWGYYPSSTKSGALRIVDVKGSRLIIQPADDKNMLFFDVPALTFVNSLEEVVTPSTSTEISTTDQPAITPDPYPNP